MFSYGTAQGHTHLPCPQIRLHARSSANPQLTCPVEAILDTGSSITCLPKQVIQQLQITVFSRKRVTLASGATITIDVAIIIWNFSRHTP